MKNLFDHYYNNRDEVKSVKKLVEVLFPNVQGLWSDYSLEGVDKDSYALKRINNDTIFDRYFSLIINKNDFDDNLFQVALEEIKNPEKIVKFICSLDSDGARGNFLDKFFSFVGKMDKNENAAIKILSSFYEIGDYIETNRSNLFKVPEIHHVERLIHYYFKNQDFNFDKKKIYKQSLEETKGIYLTLKDLYDEWKRINEERRGKNYYVFNKEDSETVKKLLKNKINHFKNHAMFKQHKELPRLISIWKIVDEKSCEKWFQDYLKDDKNFIAFLIKIESMSYVSKSKKTEINCSFQKKWFSEFFDDIDKVISRYENIKENSTSLDESENEIRISSNLKSLKEILDYDKNLED